MNDVIVNYYEKSAKDHDIASITFREGMDELLNLERVDVDIMMNAIYFRKADGKKGLKLANGKIQLWALAKQLELWEGEYPLTYDQHAECYCIRKTDMEPLSRELPGNLGRSVAKPKRKSEDTKVDRQVAVDRIKRTLEETQEERKMKDDTLRKIISPVAIEGLKRREPGSAKPERPHKTSITINGKEVDSAKSKRLTTIFYLKDKIIEYMVAGDTEKGQILAKAYQIIQEEKSGEV